MVFGLGKKKESDQVKAATQAAKIGVEGQKHMTTLANILNQPEAVPLAILSLDDEIVRGYVMQDLHLYPLIPIISRAMSTTFIDPKDLERIIQEFKGRIQKLKWSIPRSEFTDAVRAKFSFIEAYIEMKLRDSGEGWKFDRLSTRRAEVKFAEEEKEKK